MQKNIFNTLLILLLLGICNTAASKITGTVLPEPISISAVSPAIPVLKGVAANPIVRIIISVPEGNAIQQLRKIRCSINAAALKNLQKLDLYQTGAEPFSANQLLTSVNPSADDNCAIQSASTNGYLAVVNRLLQDPRVDPSVLQTKV